MLHLLAHSVIRPKAGLELPATLLPKFIVIGTRTRLTSGLPESSSTGCCLEKYVCRLLIADHLPERVPF